MTIKKPNALTVELRGKQSYATHLASPDFDPKRPILMHFRAVSGRFPEFQRRESANFTVFLLVRKLTMKASGTDKIVICRDKTIETVIRASQSGWKAFRLATTISKSSSCRLSAPAPRMRREL